MDEQKLPLLPSLFKAGTKIVLPPHLGDSRGGHN
jgi:hypothetical protein